MEDTNTVAHPTNNLTLEEVDLLIEAVSAWQSRDTSGRLIGALFGSMLSKDSEESREKFKADQERETRDAKMKCDMEAETAAILKAKLYTIRRTINR